MDLEPIPVYVLVVEDEEKIRNHNKRSVERCSDKKYQYIVDTAQDGEEALKKIETNRFQIILLDITLDKNIDQELENPLPYKENGLKFLEKIREFWKTIKVIIYTRHTGLNQEAHDYIITAINLQSFAIISKGDPPQKREEYPHNYLRKAADDLFEIPQDVTVMYEQDQQEE